MTRLKELRKKTGMSQKEFGKLFQASQNTVSQWETGIREMDFTTAIAIAKYFGVSVDYLLGNDAPQSAPPPPPDEIDAVIAQESGGLTPEEVQRVLDFIAGLKAARK